MSPGPHIPNEIKVGGKFRAASRGNLQPHPGVVSSRLNPEDIMTDYRDPNYRDPDRPDYRDPRSTADTAWSTATWGWIAGISVVVLVLIFAFGMSGDGDRTAKDATTPSTTGQRTLPPAPPAGAPSQAPSMNPAPSPTAPPTAPTPSKQ
jgi:hypothetical protein